MTSSIFQISESQETGNELNDAEPASSQPSFPADEPRRVPKSAKAAPPADHNPIPSAEDVAALEALREQIENENRKFERQLDNVKRDHAEKLAILKQENLSKEQAAANSYNLEYRDAILAITLKYLGRVILTEDIGSLLRQSLNEEEFKFEKELLDLQQAHDDELAQLRLTIRPGAPGRRHRPHRAPINPVHIAQMVYDRLSEGEPEEPNENEILEDLIRILQTAKGSLLASQAPRPGKVRPRPPPAQPIPEPRLPPRGPDPNAPGIEKHIQARKKLRKAVEQTDRFIRKVRHENWFPDFFPHVE
jgi:hypothetical protein